MRRIGPHQTSANRHAAAALAAALFFVTQACSRPIEDWADELLSDEPLTRVLAAAAMGTASTPEQAQFAVDSLFAAYRDDSAMLPWIVRSLDRFPDLAWRRARAVLRADPGNADARRLLGLVRAWLSQTTLPAATVDDWLLAELADPTARQPVRVFQVLQARNTDLGRVPENAAPIVRLQVVLLQCSKRPGDATNPSVLQASAHMLLDAETETAAQQLLAANPAPCTALMPQIHALASGADLYYRLLIPALARHVAGGRITAEAARTSLRGGGQELESALLEGAQDPDPELATLSCLGLIEIAQRPATLDLLQRLADDEQRPATVRGTARFALDALRK